MSNDLTLASVGIVSTILGVILGWLLNKLDNFGKVRTNIINYYLGFFCYKKNNTGGLIKETALYRNSTNMDILLNIEFYNKSAITKIINRPRLEFYNDNKLLKEYKFIKPLKPHSENDTHFIYFNLNPKQILTCVLKMKRLIISHEKLDTANRLYFSYENEKEKTKKKLITKIKRLSELDYECIVNLSFD